MVRSISPVLHGLGTLEDGWLGLDEAVEVDYVAQGDQAEGMTGFAYNGQGIQLFGEQTLLHGKKIAVRCDRVNILQHDV